MRFHLLSSLCKQQRLCGSVFNKVTRRFLSCSSLVLQTNWCICSFSSVDAHRAQIFKDSHRFYDQVGTTLRILERGTPWTNRVELYIWILKEAVRKDIHNSNCPLILWDYATERRATIHNVVPRPWLQNDSLNSHLATFGTQADISNICMYSWYEWIYYHDHGNYPVTKEALGWVLVWPIRNEGNEMVQAVLTAKGTIIPCQTSQKLHKSELVYSETKKRKREKGRLW